MIENGGDRVIQDDSSVFDLGIEIGNIEEKNGFGRAEGETSL